MPILQGCVLWFRNAEYNSGTTLGTFVGTRFKRQRWQRRKDDQGRRNKESNKKITIDVVPIFNQQFKKAVIFSWRCPENVFTRTTLCMLTSIRPKAPRSSQVTASQCLLIGTYDVPDTFLDTYRAVIRMTKDFVSKHLVFLSWTMTDNKQKNIVSGIVKGNMHTF